MKPIIPSTLLAALLAVGAAHAAATDPVGYVSLGDTTVGQPAIKAHTDVAVAIPLDKPAAFAGTVASVAGNVITISGTPALGSFTSAAHMAKLESGTKSGLNGLITANTANTVTIAVPAGDSLTGVVAGDAISIRPAWTVLATFGSTLPVGTQILAFSGNTPGINLAADIAYEWDGSNWLDSFTFDVADTAVLYTGESFIVRNPSNTPIASLVVSGEVPTSKSRIVVSNLAPGTGQDNRLSYVSPVNEIIGQSGLTAISSVGDQILVFNNNSAGLNKAASFIAEWDGSVWFDAFTFDDITNTFALVGGQGYVLRRASTAPGGDTIWADQPEYVGSL